MRQRRKLMGCTVLCVGWSAWAALVPDERPAQPGEWGVRPENNAVVRRNPPPFVWRPQRTAVSYELKLIGPGQSGSTGTVTYLQNLRWNATCPSQPLAPGVWTWQFRFVTSLGETSEWSQARSFTLPATAPVVPMPTLEEVDRKIPSEHPRLFLRPEFLPQLREFIRTERAAEWAIFTQRCERLLQRPPSTNEPPLYPPDLPRESDEWMKIWWGNREATIALLDGAATLAFAWRLGAPEHYAQTARAWLLAAAGWDPTGSTGYRYNDEAGMPFVYYFARAYTYVHPWLSEAERARCREVIRIRSTEMYRHLCPRQLWTPYESHQNRAWHKLGEATIAFWREIPDTRDWMEFVLLKQFCTYPVWNDEDGGWHEGLSYWHSYMQRFTWWADAFRVAIGVDLFRLPFFANVGWFPIYIAPPGAPWMGMGDLCDRRPSMAIGELVGEFASLARNPYWQWYAEQTCDWPPKPQALASGPSAYVRLVRGARPPVVAKVPTNLPTSIVFRGIGQAALHTTLLHASNDVQIIFKSSPMGTHSHGYDAQNSFVLYAYGDALLIPSGHRDQYGSAHHRNWMWETKSVNSVTLDGGQGQGRRSLESKGQIVGFFTSRAMDYVAGEAAEAYQGRLRRFTRYLLFVKPDLILLYDRIVATNPVTADAWFHSLARMEIGPGPVLRLARPSGSCRLEFLVPQDIEISQTDRFDPPPRRSQLQQWHVRASTTQKREDIRFVTAIRPWPTGTPEPGPVRMLSQESTWIDLMATGAVGVVRIRLADEPRPVTVWLQEHGKEREVFVAPPSSPLASVRTP